MLCWCNAAGAGMEWSFPSLSKRVEFQLCSICPISRALAYSPGCSLFRPFSDISVGFQHSLLGPVLCLASDPGQLCREHMACGNMEHLAAAAGVQLVG